MNLLTWCGLDFRSSPDFVSWTAAVIKPKHDVDVRFWNSNFFVLPLSSLETIYGNSNFPILEKTAVSLGFTLVFFKLIPASRYLASHETALNESVYSVVKL